MAMMRWMVHSACHVLGYSSNEKLAAGHGGSVKIDVSSAKLQTRDGDQKKMVMKKKEKCGGDESDDGNEYSDRSGFQMPLHYPRYKKSDYEKMEEWKVDMLLREYGLAFQGSLHEKRAFAIGAFLWPNQY